MKAVALFGLQSLISTFWLRKFAQGPVEYLWKKLSYKTFKKIRSKNKVTSSAFNSTLTIIFILSSVVYAQSQGHMPKGNHGFYQVENKCVDWDTASKNGFDPEFQNVI